MWIGGGSRRRPLPSDLVDHADSRAGRYRMSRSQIIGQALAAEGYRSNADRAGELAEASAQAVAEALLTCPSEGNRPDEGRVRPE
jgi:hypothetical protein